MPQPSGFDFTRWQTAVALIVLGLLFITGLGSIGEFAIACLNIGCSMAPLESLLRGAALIAGVAGFLWLYS